MNKFHYFLKLFFMNFLFELPSTNSYGYQYTLSHKHNWAAHIPHHQRACKALWSGSWLWPAAFVIAVLSQSSVHCQSVSKRDVWRSCWDVRECVCVCIYASLCVCVYVRSAAYKCVCVGGVRVENLKSRNSKYTHEHTHTHIGTTCSPVEESWCENFTCDPTQLTDAESARQKVDTIYGFFNLTQSLRLCRDS